VTAKGKPAAKRAAARVPVGIVPHAAPGKPTHAETTGRIDLDAPGPIAPLTGGPSLVAIRDLGVAVGALLARDDEPTRPSVPLGPPPPGHWANTETLAAEAARIPTTRPPPPPAKGSRVMYTNRLGVGPWPGVVLATHLHGDESRGPLAWLEVTKPNGTVFCVAAPCCDGPDAFTLADE